MVCYNWVINETLKYLKNYIQFGVMKLCREIIKNTLDLLILVFRCSLIDSLPDVLFKKMESFFLYNWMN